MLMRSFNREEKFLLLTSLFLHLVAAYFSTGFHHYDEHFQILEFASYKLGITPVSELPWEFQSQIRPWFQPWLFYGLVKGLEIVGIENPFAQVTIFRFCLGVLGWCSLLLMARCACRWFSGRDRVWVILLLSLLWFFPYQHVRTSSESLSGSLFFLGLGLMVLRAEYVFWAGLLFGLAFECRYQVGICVFFSVLWAIAFRHVALRGALWLSLGILVAVGLGTFVDSWGYSQWVFSPWNYLKINLFEGRASEFGVQPWWDYFRSVSFGAGPVLGVVIVGTMVAGWIRFPKHLLTWATLPFVCIHSLIAHKELRFLFPIATAVPFFMVLVWGWRGTRIPRWGVRVLGWLLGIVNGLLLVASIGVPARSELPFLEFLCKNQVQEIYSTEPKLLELSGFLPYFYGVQKIKVHAVTESELLEVVREASEPLWIATVGKSRLSLHAHCEGKFQTLPGFLSLESPWVLRLVDLTKLKVLTLCRYQVPFQP